MNILQVITPSRFSGAERVCVELAEELQARGHHVEVITKANSHLASALAERGVPCHVAWIRGKVNVAAPFVIARFAQRIGADLLHTHLSTASLWGAVAGRLLGIPVITHVHALNTALWYRGATHLVAVAEAVREHLIGRGIAPSKITVVHNATDLPDNANMRPAYPIRSELGLNPSCPLIVVTAHLSAKKGHRVLLKALEVLSQRQVRFACLCLGDGPELASLQELSRKSGLEDAVRFLGFREDARQIVQEAEVVVLPSIRGEGLPLSLLEAAAAGKPIVASRLAGIPEIVVDAETGYVVQAGDPPALAARLESLLLDAALRKRMGELARQRAETLFVRERRAEAIEQIYLETLASAGAAPQKASAELRPGALERAIGRKPR